MMERRGVTGDTQFIYSRAKRPEMEMQKSMGKERKQIVSRRNLGCSTYRMVQNVPVDFLQPQKLVFREV